MMMNKYIYIYMDSDDKDYYFNVNFKLLKIVDFGNNMQHIDIQQ